MADSLLPAALGYIAAGFPVFPLKPDKTPYTRNGFKDAATDEKACRALWQRHPAAQIGIPTGRASGWLVLHRDDRHGGDVSLSALVEQHGDFAPLEACTPSGGRHYVFAYPAEMEVRNSAGKVGPGLDVRGEGGYIVAPPGRGRAWLNSLKTAAPPAWLIERATAKVSPPVNQDYQPTGRITPGIIIPAGERGVRVFKIGCAIWGKGEARDAHDLYRQLTEVNSQRCAPPLEDEEVTAIAASISARYPRGPSRANGSAAPFITADEIFIPTGATDEDIDRIYAGLDTPAEQLGGER